MTPDEKNILRKALIEIDCQLRQVRGDLDFYKIKNFPKMQKNIHAIKKKLLKDLKMPEAEWVQKVYGKLVWVMTGMVFLMEIEE